jgi:hypothetical protein
VKREKRGKKEEGVFKRDTSSIFRSLVLGRSVPYSFTAESRKMDAFPENWEELSKVRPNFSLIRPSVQLKLGHKRYGDRLLELIQNFVPRPFTDLQFT